MMSVLRRLTVGNVLYDKPWPELLMARLGMGVDRRGRQFFEPVELSAVRDP